MLSIKKIRSDASAESLKSYVVSRVGGSVLLERGSSIGLKLQFRDAEVVSPTDFDEYRDFMTGVGADSSACKEWLVGRILAFLGQTAFPLVLIEDFIADPADAVFSLGTTAPMWCYQHRVFWPIYNDMANAESCNGTLAWAAGGPEAIFFCSAAELRDLTVVPSKFAIPEDLFGKVTKSLKCLITGVFDSEGYVVVPIG